MPLNSIIFLILSLVTIVSALIVVFAKNPVYSVLSLIITMFSIAGHYILLSAEFIAIVNIIVYAGAIMVLFLFVLMLLNLNEDSEPQKSIIFKFLTTITIGVLCTLMLYIYKVNPTLKSEFQQVKASEGFGTVKSLGAMLFTDYVFPFELASILFLAAMVGSVFLGNRIKLK